MDLPTWRMPKQSEPQNWPEDFSHENGNYNCECVRCGGIFIGHKRRVLCKTCADIAQSMERSRRADALTELAEIDGPMIGEESR